MSKSGISTTRRPYLIFSIYLLFFLFFVFKMLFYTHFVGRFPDEIAHISYITYLESNPGIIPDFKNMTILSQAAPPTVYTGNMSDRQGYSGTFIFSKSTNYLGHPPLYYQVMRLSGGIRIQGDTVIIDILRLREFSMSLATLAILLVFYIGYSRLGNRWALHLLYAAICVSVPMLAYDCAGINNDTLAFVGVSIYLLGILRFAENKQNFSTFLLLSLGVFVALLSKLTAGAIVILSLILFLLIYLWKEKNLRFLLSWRFLATIPIYAFAILYFLLIHQQTGSFQPSLGLLNPQQYYQSGFYVQPPDRTHMDFITYSKYYFNRFSGSWTGIASHVELLKNEHTYSLGRIGLNLLWVLPILAILPLTHNKRLTSMQSATITIYLAVVLTAIIQFIKAYMGYKNGSGYLGGFQSRYYLCAVPAMALAIVIGVKNVFGLSSNDQILSPTDVAEITPESIGRQRHIGILTSRFLSKPVIGQIICFLFTLLLLYEDFVYFLLNFKQYI
jgi:hypothetical protein